MRRGSVEQAAEFANARKRAEEQLRRKMVDGAEEAAKEKCREEARMWRELSIQKDIANTERRRLDHTPNPALQLTPSQKRSLEAKAYFREHHARMDGVHQQAALAMVDVEQDIAGLHKRYEGKITGHGASASQRKNGFQEDEDEGTRAGQLEPLDAETVAGQLARLEQAQHGSPHGKHGRHGRHGKRNKPEFIPHAKKGEDGHWLTGDAADAQPEDGTGAKKRKKKRKERPMLASPYLMHANAFLETAGLDESWAQMSREVGEAMEELEHPTHRHHTHIHADEVQPLTLSLSRPPPVPRSPLLLHPQGQSLTLFHSPPPAGARADRRDGRQPPFPHEPAGGAQQVRVLPVTAARRPARRRRG